MKRTMHQCSLSSLASAVSACLERQKGPESEKTTSTCRIEENENEGFYIERYMCCWGKKEIVVRREKEEEHEEADQRREERTVRLVEEVGAVLPPGYGWKGSGGFDRREVGEVRDEAERGANIDAEGKREEGGEYKET